MKIRIQAKKVTLPKSLPEHVERRVGLALGRFAGRIDRVILRFSEAGAQLDDGGRAGRNQRARKDGRADGEGKNGRSKRTEKRCEIVVSLLSRKVRVEDTDTDLVAAFDRAVSRASRTIARAIEREGWWATGAPEAGRLREARRLPRLYR